MRACLYILFILNSLSIKGKDFVITHIHSPNPFYEWLADRHISRKGNRVITVAFKDSLAYVSYKGEKGKVIFRRCDTDARTYYKHRHGLTALLRFDSDTIDPCLYVTISGGKHRKPKLNVTLKPLAPCNAA